MREKLKRLGKQEKKKGKIQYIMDLDGLSLHDGEWLILGRYNDRLKKLMPTLKDMGIYYQYKGRKSYKSSLFRSILNYTRWTKRRTTIFIRSKRYIGMHGYESKTNRRKDV